MAARESVIVLIAVSRVVRADCEPAAVVSDKVDTPAPAVAVAEVAAIVKPVAAKTVAATPPIVIPAESEEDKETAERVVRSVLVSVLPKPVMLATLDVPVAVFVIVMLRPSAADKATAPFVAKVAVTPV